MCKAALLALAGCSNMPTEPQSVIQPGSSTTVTDGASAEVLSLGLSGGSTSSAMTKSVVVGVRGGVVSVGDFTVVIPAGTLTQTATVTVSQPDLAHPVVNLSISPPSANRFLLPVLLVADAKYGTAGGLGGKSESSLFPNGGDGGAGGAGGHGGHGGPGGGGPSIGIAEGPLDSTIRAGNVITLGPPGAGGTTEAAGRPDAPAGIARVYMKFGT